ncbi:MAG: hypothetical protein KDD04_03610 [Sinomicrobium sp.]|nr:hypothetical protein [Sinomicrobium sp.]
MVLVFSVVLCSCGSTNLLTLSVAEPAPVHIPPKVKKIGIVNRSLPSEGNETLDKIDKILSAEGKNLDKEGAGEAIAGLSDELKRNDRFSEVKIIENAGLRSPGLGVFPAALPWQTVQQLCDEHRVDAVFVLSFYDTDTKVDYTTAKTEIANPLGIKIPAIEHRATVNTLIKNGWRIYDPADKLLLDEFPIHQNVVLTGKGINPMSAIGAITGRKEAVLQLSRNSGAAYALRILPYSIRVSRDYYVKGTENFEIAKRRAQTGDWDGAAELWYKEVSNPNGKIAGRACYNMAIISEINGDLDAAMDWASKSYADYKDKRALKYLNILKYRKERSSELQYQMKNE